jgi:hypothetical protein
MPTRRTGQIDLFTKRVRRAPAAPEFALHCMVADTLRRWCRPDWRWTHIASGELRTAATAAKLSRMGVVPGWSDFILLSPTGVAHFLELKRKGSGRLSEAQLGFEAYCARAGYPFEVVDDYALALRVLQAWGAVASGIRVAA